MTLPRIFGLAALTLGCLYAETHAGFAVLRGDALTALGLHLGCALVAGLSAGALAVKPPRRFSISSLAGTLLLVLTTPIVGLALVLVVGLPSWLRRPPARAATRLVEHALPKFSSELLSDPTARGGERRALSPERRLEQRIAATKALRHMEPARAVPLLKLALTDPAEDVRLLAHALLDRRERTIRVALEENEQRLAAASKEGRSVEERAAIHAEIASQYWELCYAGLVSGESERAALARAADHACTACHGGAAASTVLLAIRAHLKLGQLGDAAALLTWAAVRGVSAAQRAPLAAELAFLQRRFEEVPRALAALPSLARHHAQLRDVARFWQARERS